MKTLAVILLFLAFVYAEDEVDWSSVKPAYVRLPIYQDIKSKLPYPYNQERIVGGEEAIANSIPQQAALLVTTAAGTFFCGGSLISTRYVLTAAHCLDNAVQIEVRLGAHRVTESEDTQKRIFTTTYVKHAGWDIDTLLNDIAIVELPEPVQLNENVQLIPLPTYSDIGNTFYGVNARISGWGADSDSAESISPILRQVFVDVQTNIICNIQFLGLIQSSHMCTSGSNGVGACGGDSGGPLVYGNQQIGVVSFGLGIGCEIGWPTVLARVTSYLDWIANNSDVIIFS